MKVTYLDWECSSLPKEGNFHTGVIMVSKGRKPKNEISLQTSFSFLHVIFLYVQHVVDFYSEKVRNVSQLLL